MARAVRKLKVAAGSEIAELLEAANSGPLLLEKDGKVYRLYREGSAEEDIWAGYDPEEVRAAVDKTAGTWADIDADALIAEIYRVREEGSRPENRPKWLTSLMPIS